MRACFDIETNGLLHELTTIHCLVIKDLNTGKVYSCTDNDETKLPIAHGLSLLSDADVIIGHNIQEFDIPAILKLYPDFKYKKHIDTLICCRAVFPHIFDIDIKIKTPKHLMGRHSLESYGYRLGKLKGTFGKTTDWSEWTSDMQKYCEQDVEVTEALVKRLEVEITPELIDLEQRFRSLMKQQEDNGIDFDIEAAKELAETIRKEIDDLRKEISIKVPNRVQRIAFTPKRDNKTLGYVKGKTVIKEREIVFNPNSRPMMIEFLKAKYGWEPIKFTPHDNPKIDSDVLDSLPYPEAKLFSEYAMRNKVMAYIETGKAAWLSCIKEDGKIHGRIKTNKAISGRCGHSNPNLGNVVAVRSYKGKECRALFKPPKGMVMVGADASGLELRNLAHYLFPYDNGLYRDKILTSDIHTENQKDSGAATRDIAKRFIYCFIYGGGNEKIGEVLVPELSVPQRIAAGKSARNKFIKNVTGLANLQNDISKIYKQRGFLVGVDKRKLYPRAEHAALNILLQHTGAVVMKRAPIILWDMIDDAGLANKVVQLLHVHDEVQLGVHPNYAEDIGKWAVSAIIEAGKYYKFNCPLDGEYKIGNNWMETH